jgi:hypothetical protein
MDVMDRLIGEGYRTLMYLAAINMRNRKPDVGLQFILCPQILVYPYRWSSNKKNNYIGFDYDKLINFEQKYKHIPADIRTLSPFAISFPLSNLNPPAKFPTQFYVGVSLNGHCGFSG